MNSNLFTEIHKLMIEFFTLYQRDPDYLFLDRERYETILRSPIAYSTLDNISRVVQYRGMKVIEVREKNFIMVA